MDSLDAVIGSLDLDPKNLGPLGEHGSRIMPIPWSRSLEVWRGLRANVERTGYWPVLLGGSEDLDSLLEWLEFAQPRDDPQTLIEKRLRLDAEALFEGWLEELTDSEDDEMDAPPRGDWPEQVEEGSSDFYTLNPLRFGGLPAEMYLGLIPTSRPWEVPAFLNFGGWNACPAPEKHVAVLKYWFERYGVEAVILTRDTLEMAVSEPPRTRDAALLLAQEQFGYCDDIVYQGVGTLDALAATLLDSPRWYFWWD